MFVCWRSGPKVEVVLWDACVCDVVRGLRPAEKTKNYVLCSAGDCPRTRLSGSVGPVGPVKIWPGIRMSGLLEDCER